MFATDSQAFSPYTPTQGADSSHRDPENWLEDNADDIIMAVDVSRNADIGCAYYIAQDQKLFLLTDLRNSSLEVLATLKAHVQPSVVILPFRVSETAEAYFDPHAGLANARPASPDAIRLPYELEYRSSADFSYEAARKRMLEIQRQKQQRDHNAIFVTPGYDDVHDNKLSGEEAGVGLQQGKLLNVASKIDIESRLTVGCAGAVIAYVQRRKALQSVPGDPFSQSLFEINDIDSFNIGNSMFINDDTLASLQILQTENSPNANDQGPSGGPDGGKEALSVYGLFYHFARTPQGKQNLRQILSRPTLDLRVINSRLNAISLLLRPENETNLRMLSKNFGCIRNIKIALTQLRKGINEPGNRSSARSSVWSNIRLFAYHTLQIRDAFEELSGAETVEFGKRVLEGIKPGILAFVGTRISDIIDFEASVAAHRAVVRPGVDDTLDRMKHAYDGMEDMLNLVSQELAATIHLPRNTELNVVFFPQIGFLISIPCPAEAEIHRQMSNSTDPTKWALIFTSPGRAYFKEKHTRDLDETWGDVYASICDMEIEIVHKLASQILEHEEILSSMSELCGELDCMVALAKGAKQYRLARPCVVEHNVLEIQGGRHLLQECMVPAFIPNGTHLVGGSGMRSHEADSTDDSCAVEADGRGTPDPSNPSGPSMCIMSGPNFSGKSVYLRQVAMIVYMAHIGCYVPAAQATIGLTDAILTRVTTRESVTRLLSSYVIDVQQIALALNSVTRRSLVLIDEFGKGTNPHDGAGLMCGVLKNLLNRRCERPKVLAATHFHEIFELGHLIQQPSLTFAHMEVKVMREVKSIKDSVIYLYNLKPGRINSSYGRICAARSGVDASIIARARQMEDLSCRGEDLVSACARVSEHEAVGLREAEGVARDFLAQDLREND